MKILWCDTETTGLDPENAAPFQIAFLYSDIQEDKQVERDTIFYLNPLNKTILFNEEASKVHGYSEDTIKSFTGAKEAIPEIADFLDQCVSNFNQFEDNSLPYFAGYNCNFDYKHLVKLFSDYGYNFTKYVQPTQLDVFDQVKRAGYARVLPYLQNRKLTTIANFLGINMDHAHDAMCDITTTREVAKSLNSKGINLIK